MHSIEILSDGFRKKGWSAQTLQLGSKGSTFTQVVSPRGGEILFAWEKYQYPFLTTMSNQISVDKSASYDYVEKLGIRTPQTRMVAVDGVDDLTAADITPLRFPLVVKPYDGGLSKGLTINIMNLPQIVQAVKKISGLSTHALIQEQFVGEEYRFVVLDGTVRAVMIRQRPYVVGNGNATVQELVDLENQKRKDITDTVVAYPLLERSMMYPSLSYDEVLKDGERIELNAASMIRDGASVFNVIDTIDPTYVHLAEQAASSMSRGIIAVDMLIKDCSQEAHDSNYVFLEYNSKPALALFYSCRDGKHFDIVGDYLVPMIAACLGE